MPITATGVGSGLDVNSIVAQLVAAERAPGELRLSTAERETNSQISAFGSIASTLGDLQAAIEKFDDAGALASRKTTVAEGAGFSATATTDAAPGRYQISVESLAQAHRLQSAAVALDGSGNQTQLGYGTLSISVGGATAIDVTIDQGAGTLNDIRDAINDQAGDAVSATVVRGDSGDVLFVTSRTSGVNGAVSISASGGDGGLSVLDTTTGTITTKDAAQNAQVVIDGITRTSESNTLSDAISGITLKLDAAEPGTAFALDVTEDPSSLEETLNGFVTAYNAAITKIRTVSASGGQDAVAGALSGDATPRSIQQTLRNTISSAYEGLSALGLKTAVDGTLSLDTTKLDTTLSTDATAVKKLFGENADFGKGIRDALNNFLGDQGLVTSRQNSLGDRLEALADKRDAFDARIERLEAAYRRQFTALDAMMAKLNSTSSYVSQQLSLL